MMNLPAITNSIELAGIQKYAQQLLRENDPFDRNAADYDRKIATAADTYFKDAQENLKRIYPGSTALKDFDYQGEIFRRRKSASGALTSEAVARLNGKYSNLSAEKEFLKLAASVVFLGYNGRNGYKYYTTAVALFILDEIKKRGFLPWAIPYITIEAEPEELLDLGTPENLYDHSFDEDLILNLVYIIHHRNDNVKGYKKNRPLVDAAAAKRKTDTVTILPYLLGNTEERFLYSKPYTEEELHEISQMNCRDRMDHILAFIHPVVRERAVNRFTDKFWELFDRYMKLKSRTDKQKNNYLRQLIRIESPEAEATNILQNRTTVSGLNKQFPVFAAFGNAARESAYDEANRYFNQAMSIETNQDKFRMSLGSGYFKGKAEGQPSKQIDTDLYMAFSDFSVANPYETCYAFFWMLDSGDDYPWIYSLSLGVMHAAGEQLPWNLEINPYRREDEYDWLSEDEDDDVIQEENTDVEYDEPEEDASSGSEKPLVPVDWIEEEKKLYERRYTDVCLWDSPEDAVPENVVKMNLPQLIYEETGVIMPRNFGFFGDCEEEFKMSGFSPETASLMQFILSMAYTPQFRTEKRYDLDETSEDESEETDEPDSDNEDYRKLASDRKEEIRKLRKLLHETEKELEEEKKRCAQQKMEFNADQNELLSLRNLIFSLQTGTEEKLKPEEEKITLPYTVRRRTVVVGGHDSWLRAIRPMLNEVRFAEGSTLDANLIRNADIVWLQVNAMPHTIYNNVMDIIRKRKIEVRYFSCASAEKCARQLVAEDMRSDL